MPVAMSRPHIVSIGDSVFIGGGGTTELQDSHIVMKYDLTKDEWSTLPESPVYLFGLVQLLGDLITVGGVRKGRTTGRVYTFKEPVKSGKGKWAEVVKPMPTARFKLSVMAYKSSLVAIGGATSVTDALPVPCSTVEVYSSDTTQWYTANPLPKPASDMSFAVLSSNCYLIGGFSTESSPILEMYTCSLDALIEREKITKGNKQPESISIWKGLAETPLNAAAVTTISDTIVALGGAQKESCYPFIYVYIAATDMWIRVDSWELPYACYLQGAQQISSNQVIITGGWDSSMTIVKNAYIGRTITSK